MKGITTITLTKESVTQALQRYLNSHLLHSVNVLSWSVDSSYGEPNVSVKFEEVQVVLKGQGVSSSAEPVKLTEESEPVVWTSIGPVPEGAVAPVTPVLV